MARSKAQQVSAKPAEVTLEGVDPEGNETEVTWKIHALDMDTLLEVESMPENANKERLQHILYNTLVQDDPNVTEDEVLEMDAGFIMSIMEKIGEVNGIEDFFDEEEIKSAMENRA